MYPVQELLISYKHSEEWESSLGALIQDFIEGNFNSV